MAVALLTDSHPGDPALDAALGPALLHAVAAGRHGEALRIFRPGPTMAFGRLDAGAPGFAAAAAAAAAHGLVPVIRAAGGRAAAYDAEAVVVEHITSATSTAPALEPRFEDQSRRLATALRALGADVRIGELPGEYCPGRYSINVAGRLKVAGIAQRVVRGAALTAAVVVVGHGPRIRAAIADGYAALGLAVDPATAGALDEVLVGADADAVAAAIRAAYADDLELVPEALAPGLVQAGRALRPRHAVAL